MEDIIRKGMRYRKPIEVRLKLRPAVYDWLVKVSEGPPHCAVEVLARGLIEDAYDKRADYSAAPEVSGNEK